MVTNISYNVMIDRLRAFATGHYLIKHFSHGQIDLRYLEQGADYYPWMHVIPGTITPAEGLREYSFDITFSDLTRDKDHEAEYIREAISDCTRLAEDLLAEIKNGNTLFDSSVQIVDGSSITPFIHEDTHTLTGVTLSLSIRVPWNWSACDIPANYAPGGSGSGGEAIGGCCVTLQVGGVDNIDQTLLNLIAGTNMTITDNGDGSVTFDSTGGIGSVSWGQILGTLSNQVDLQNALDLKADITSLAAVATSGDYNDLLNLPSLATVATTGDYNDLNNLPTIPAAQVNSDWNAVSGVAEILNKPTIPAAQIQSDWTQTNNAALDYIKNKPSGLPPTGSAGGDLTGSYPNPTVHKIHGVDMQSGTPSTDEVWVYGGSPAKWQHQHLGADQVNNTSSVTGTSVKDALDHLDQYKQASLVSGTNIKTIEGQSLLGSGNIDLSKSDVGLSNVDNTSDANKPVSTATQTALNAKQDSLVSGTNIKTIEGQSLVGAGNIDLTKSDVGLSNVDNTSDLSKPISTATQTALNGKQDTLVSGTNIKTVNSTSLLGSGDVAVQPTLVSGTNIKTVNSTSLLGSGNVSVGTVTSVSGTGTTAGLSLSGSVTTSGSLTLSGTLSTPVNTISDSTTVGQNIVKLANPSAVRYIKIAADNTVSAITAAQLKTDLGIPSGTMYQLVTTSDQTSNSTASIITYDITGLTFTITSGKTYRFKALLLHTASSTQVSVRVGINANVAVTSVNQQISLGTVLNAQNQWFNLNALGTVAFAGANLTAQMMSTVEGILIANNTGTAAIQFSKGAANAGTLTIKAGSILEYYEI